VITQRPEARGQRPEARGQRPEARGQKEARSQKPEARNNTFGFSIANRFQYLDSSFTFYYSISLRNLIGPTTITDPNNRIDKALCTT
jgi:hypothetical protein